MFDKLNPFKKSAKTEQESGNIQPTKSTASVADSIKSLGDKTAQKMSDAPKPTTPFDRSRASNANMDNSGLGSGGLAPISSAGIR